MVRTFSTGNKKPCKPKDNTKKGSHGSKNQIIFEFEAVIVNSFNFFHLLRLSFLLKSMSAIVTFDANTRTHSVFKNCFVLSLVLFFPKNIRK